MKGIPNAERQRLGALLDHETQETVMAMIPQFSETEIGAPVPAPAEVPEELGLLVFNMERGVHLEELGDFLQDCPGIRPLDVVLANELDDGCVRSGGRNTARELAERCLRSAWCGFLRSWRSFLRAGLLRPAKNYSCLRFTLSFAACLVAPAFSSRKFFPAKRIGAHRSRIRS